MWFARERVRTGQVEPSNGGKGLKTLLDGAFEDVTKEKAILAGASIDRINAVSASGSFARRSHLQALRRLASSRSTLLPANCMPRTSAILRT